MKKTILIIIFTLSFNLSKANPIVPPPLISEIYFQGGKWYVELSDLYYNSYYPLTNFDSLKLCSNGGEAFFKNGIVFDSNHVVVITIDSLQTPLTIDSSGDYISIKDMNEIEIIAPFVFGPGGYVNSPLPGQSLKVMTCQYYPDVDFYYVKTNQPSMGSDPFTSVMLGNYHDVGNFFGYVYDALNNPIDNAKLYYLNSANYCFQNPYVLTDSNGYFHGNRYAMTYNIRIFLLSDPTTLQLDSIISIEPDSNNYYEFHLNNVYQGVNEISLNEKYSIKCFPNPTANAINIEIEIPQVRKYNKSIVKIYNSLGEIVRILPVTTDNSNGKCSIKWDGNSHNKLVSAGEYVCSLELDGQRIALTKLLMTK